MRVDYVHHGEGIWFHAFSALVLLCIFLAIYLELLFIGLLPLAVLFTIVACQDLSKLFYLLFAVLPFTVEYNFPNGLGIDIPAEPLMMLIAALSVGMIVVRAHSIPSRYVLNPISLLLLLHLVWIVFASIYSHDVIRSAKFILAKLWFIIPFYALPFWFLKSEKQILSWIKILLISVTTACIYVWINHAPSGFSFQEINHAVHPVFRNHVNYAGMLLVTIPFFWVYLSTKSLSKLAKLCLYTLGLFLVISIVFSYTRAAMISLLLGVASSIVIHYKLLRPLLIVGMIGTVVVVCSLIQDNQFINYAPDYERTISHQRFDNLIEATAKGEDISTMERAYRWVAGGYMVQDRPLTGFGPGTFYTAYEAYTLSIFSTYVSHNPDQSTIHNYFFLILVEQGVFGLIIFVWLCLYALTRGEALYHYYYGFKRRLVLAATVLLIMILLMNLINDMVESLKVGSFFFISLFIIAKYDMEMREEKRTLSAEYQ